MVDWGTLPPALSLEAHKTRHQDGGADEIAITGLSGLLADDQHVLDAEVTAVAVARALYDAYTILIATADDTPIALTVAEQTLIGRITGGVIAALTVAQARTLLNLAEGTHIADPTGGAVVDTEARTVINAILVRLEEKDINATS